MAADGEGGERRSRVRDPWRVWVVPVHLLTERCSGGAAPLHLLTVEDHSG
jgi:hypothetical protein